MNLSYRIAWTCFRAMYATYFHWRVYGAENVPLTGGVILPANHASYLDPFLIGSGLKRAINYLGRESLFRFPGVGALLLFRRWQVPGAWGIIAVSVAVFPANVQMALHPELFQQFSPLGLWLRLPLQLVPVVWAWCYTRDTPQRR